MYSWWSDRNLISRMWCLFLLLNTMKNPWWMSSRTARFFSFLLNFHLGCVLLWIDHEGSRILKSTMRVLSFKNILKTSRVLRINGVLRTFNHWIILLENRLLRIYCLLRTEVKFVFLHDSFSKIFCFILTNIRLVCNWFNYIIVIVNIRIIFVINSLVGSTVIQISKVSNFKIN